MEHNFQLFDIYDMRGKECGKCNRGEACEEHKFQREIVKDLDYLASLNRKIDDKAKDVRVNADQTALNLQKVATDKMYPAE